MTTDTHSSELPRRRARAWQAALKHPGLLFGGLVLAGMLAMGLLAPLIAPFDPYAQDITKRLIDPVWHPGGGWLHPLGTDHLGRDYLSRMIPGTAFNARTMTGITRCCHVPEPEIGNQRSINPNRMIICRASQKLGIA